MYNWLKDIAQWKIGKTLYLSVVFSWDIPKAIELAKNHKGKVIFGGPAAIIAREQLSPIGPVKYSFPRLEPILFHNPLATFTSRGCPNRCKFCPVSDIEPGFSEIHTFRPAPVVCDNNFLATSEQHQGRVVQCLMDFDLVDFNQGLDVRLFNKKAADRLSRIKLHARFAFDHIGLESKVADAVALCKKRTTKKISVYVLVGYDDTPEDALYRLEKVREWGALPNPMRYQPLDTTKRNAYCSPAWTDRELKRVCRYYSRLNYWGAIPFSEFQLEPESLFGRAK